MKPETRNTEETTRQDRELRPEELERIAGGAPDNPGALRTLQGERGISATRLEVSFAQG